MANQAKSDFLAVIGHEMRTPLNSVIGFSSILLSDNTLTDEQHDYIGYINKAGENLLVNINDIIDFVSLDRSEFTLDLRHFNFQSLLTDINAEFTAKAKERKLSFNLECDNLENNIVFGDPRRLKQIVRHLISNSIKFTDQGGIRFHVSTETTESKDLLNYIFIIEDTGCGIPGDKLVQIFEIFSQLEDPSIRKYGGFGLGLSVCRKLVHFMSGLLEIIRSDSSGTTIKVSIPLPTSSRIASSD